MFARDTLFFWCFYQAVGDQGRVWGLADNSDKGILVLGRWIPGGVVQIELFVLPWEREGSGLYF